MGPAPPSNSRISAEPPKRPAKGVLPRSAPGRRIETDWMSPSCARAGKPISRVILADPCLLKRVWELEAQTEPDGHRYLPRSANRRQFSRWPMKCSRGRPHLFRGGFGGCSEHAHDRQPAQDGKVVFRCAEVLTRLAFALPTGGGVFGASGSFCGWSAAAGSGIRTSSQIWV